MCVKYNGFKTHVASEHDDFTSILPTETYGGWSKLVSGSGQFDIGIYVKAGGGGVLDNPDPFPDALNSQASTRSFTGTWGGDQDPGNILTIGEVDEWLQQPPGADYPYFYLDLAEPGKASGSLLQFTGHVYLTDESGVAIEGANWAFDNLLQSGTGDYDSTAWVDAPGEVVIFINGDPHTIDNNRGSGKPDFIAYAPTMILSNYDDDYLFWTPFSIDGMAGAGEEIYLTKLTQVQVIPEPGILGLLGVGLLGPGFAAPAPF